MTIEQQFVHADYADAAESYEALSNWKVAAENWRRVAQACDIPQLRTSYRRSAERCERRTEHGF